MSTCIDRRQTRRVWVGGDFQVTKGGKTAGWGEVGSSAELQRSDISEVKQKRQNSSIDSEGWAIHSRQSACTARLMRGIHVGESIGLLRMSFSRELTLSSMKLYLGFERPDFTPEDVK